MSFIVDKRIESYYLHNNLGTPKKTKEVELMSEEEFCTKEMETLNKRYCLSEVIETKKRLFRKPM